MTINFALLPLNHAFLRLSYIDYVALATHIQFLTIHWNIVLRITVKWGTQSRKTWTGENNRLLQTCQASPPSSLHEVSRQ